MIFRFLFIVVLLVIVSGVVLLAVDKIKRRDRITGKRVSVKDALEEKRADEVLEGEVGAELKERPLPKGDRPSKVERLLGRYGRDRERRR